MRHLYWNYRLFIPIKNFSKLSMMILTHSSNFFPIILILAFCFDLNFCNLKDFLISKLNIYLNLKFHYIHLLFSEDNQQIIFLLNNVLNVKARMVLLLLILFFLFRLCEYLDYFLFQEEVLNYRWLKEEFIENDFIGISKVNLLLNHL